jgi:hypothetical protein
MKSQEHNMRVIHTIFEDLNLYFGLVLHFNENYLMNSCDGDV